MDDKRKLDDNELDQVTGGAGEPVDDGVSVLYAYTCTKCGNTYAVLIPPLDECPNKNCNAKNEPGKPPVIVALV